MSKAKTKTKTASTVIPMITLVITGALTVEAIKLGSTGQGVLFGLATFCAFMAMRKTRS
jgi:predicted cobalt transporter CbtA